MLPLQHAVSGALIELMQAAPLSDGKVSFAWQTAVGPALARATAVKLEHGVLIVETSSAQWAREVKRSQRVILSRLQPLLGKETVTSITTRAPKA
jgi:predicted nucleic acid-binding Zn ribbon protein